jgi:hypothetical protein
VAAVGRARDQATRSAPVAGSSPRREPVQTHEINASREEVDAPRAASGRWEDHVAALVSWLVFGKKEDES